MSMENKELLSVNIYRNGSFVETIEAEEGKNLGEMAEKYDNDENCPIVISGTVHGLQELSESLTSDMVDINFITPEKFNGYRTLERAIMFVFFRAAYEVAGVKSKVSIENSLDKGLYCKMQPYEGWLDEEMVEKIKKKMQDIINSNDKFEKFYMFAKDAKAVLSQYYEESDLEIVDYCEDLESVEIYRCGWLWDYFYGPLPPSTGCIKAFDLVLIDGGILMRLPDVKKPWQLPEFKHDSMMSDMFQESHEWMDLIGIPYVSDLNRAIKNDTYRRVIQISEALHEKKIARIADAIGALKKRIVLVAGPSSSGKTSFAQRLSVQLNVKGIKVCTLSTDDYFVDREFVEKDEKGNYKFEDLEAVDVKLFNEQLNQLLNGETVDIPVYDFISGKKTFGSRIKKLEPGETILIEGIHALNEALTPQIKSRDKFKIYISPLTSIGLDAHNRIYTSDARLYRRLVRDYRTRGKGAADTLKSWSEVRAGEEKNIFPFQEEADVMFNSALPYELAVLKKYAEPILKEVEPGTDGYVDAQRMLKMLSFFLELPDERAILNNSLFKEFIGGTCLFEE